MNCPKCNNPLREGAKFCTKCGEKIVQAAQSTTSNACPQCGATLREGAKFCTKCGCKLGNAAVPVVNNEKKPQVSEDMATSKGRIYWNIQPGQIARVITEQEFDSYSKVQGIIISEGTTAYIRANGHTIASISGGTYDFIENAGQPTAAFKESVRQGWSVLTNLFKSRARKAAEAAAEPTPEELYKQQQNAILENAKRGVAFSVVIVLDKAFPLYVGAKQANLDDYATFVPMKIKTRYLEMAVGVNAYFKITEPERFITHYLTDRQLANNALVVDEIADTVRVTLQEVLGDQELKENRIPKELHNTIKERLNEVAPEAFFGLSIVRIVEISAENKDLERMAALSRELYLSEQELDYLRRTNDFKNRLADANNSQRLHEATSEAELRRQLDTINRDNLLQENELKIFEHLLQNERVVREAKSDEEREAALAEIAQSQFVREADMQLLKQQKVSAIQLMQLRDSIEFERVRLEGQLDLEELAERKKLELQTLKDDYADRRFNIELQQRRDAANAALDIEQRQRDMNYEDERRRREMDREDDAEQFRQFMAMQQAEEQSKENERQHEQAMQQARLQNAENMERLKWEGARDLSDEKVWAMQGGEAAVAYAQSKYNAEAERQANERLEAQRREMEARLDAERAARDQDSRADKDRMFEMMNNMMSLAAGNQAQKLDEREQQLRERDERIRRQEQRMDTAYDRALDYTTRNNVQPQQYAQPQQPVAQQQQPTPASKNIMAAKCPECGANLVPGERFCGECGTTINA